MKRKSILGLLFCTFSFAAFSQLAEPVKGDGQKYGFTVNNVYFEVNAELGARISSWKIDNKEFMYLTGDMSGSTFWPSPQSVWGWPPATAFDSDPYTVKIENNKLICTGQVDSKSLLQFYKVFYANASDTSITIEYVIKNTKSKTQKWAPWEITRVPHNGITFFGKGDGSVTGDMSSSTSEDKNCVWYNQNEDKTGNKFFCDGKGWLAHVNTSNQMFIKVFQDIPKENAATGEAEIEVYTSPDNSYTELENQGAYVEIPSNDSITWKVRWYVRDLPNNITPAVGEQKLIDFATSYAKRDIFTSVEKSTLDKSKVSVYPNPASNSLKIALNEYSNFKILVRNLNGQTLIEKSLSGKDSEIDIKSLKSGVYLYEVQLSSNRATGNFVINR